MGKERRRTKRKSSSLFERMELVGDIMLERRYQRI